MVNLVGEDDLSVEQYGGKAKSNLIEATFARKRHLSSAPAEELLRAVT